MTSGLNVGKGLRVKERGESTVVKEVRVGEVVEKGAGFLVRE